MTRPDDPPPGILAEIAELIGFVSVEKLARELGGESVHVPKPQNLREGHALVQCLGMREAAIIAGTFGGEVVYIPSAREWVGRRMAARGTPSSVIARTLDVSRRTARRYRKAG